MNTPICDFIKSYADKKLIRAHMPGHKGKELMRQAELSPKASKTQALSLVATPTIRLRVRHFV